MSLLLTSADAATVRWAVAASAVLFVGLSVGACGSAAENPPGTVIPDSDVRSVPVESTSATSSAAALTGLPTPSAIGIAPELKHAYAEAGGMASLGAPIASATCGLAEQACIQDFAKGTVYRQNSGKVWVSDMTGDRGEIAAVLRSQVGTKQTIKDGARLKTKYSEYVEGGQYLWCTHLYSWASYASGNGELIPRIASFKEFKPHVVENWTRLDKPAPGAFVLMDGIDAPLGHLAFIWDVPSKNRLTIIEGNWGKRVNMRTIPVVPNMQYYEPYR